MKKIHLLFLLIGLSFLACDNKDTAATATTDLSAKNSPKPVSPSVDGKETPPIKEYYGLERTGLTTSGFEYIKHVDAKGRTLTEGDYAYFRFHIKRRDSILSTSSGEDIGRFQIPTQAEIDKQPQPSPVLEGIMAMGIGDSLSVYFPVSNFPRPVPGFKDEAYITYSLFLEDIKDEAAYKKDMELKKQEQEKELKVVQAREGTVGKEVAATAKAYASGQLDSKIKTTPSGLKYLIHEAGTGVQPVPGNTVIVQYYGALTNGEMFDNSFKKGQPFNFPLGQGRVIKGWDEGIALLKEGARATLFVPAELGYGAGGSPPVIPGGAELIFYVELEKVFK